MKKTLAYGAIAAAALTGAAAGADVFAEETESTSAADTITATEIEGTDWQLPEESESDDSAGSFKDENSQPQKLIQSDRIIKVEDTDKTDTDLMADSHDLSAELKQNTQTEPESVRKWLRTTSAHLRIAGRFPNFSDRKTPRAKTKSR